MRILFISLFVFIQFGVFAAAPTKRAVSDTIQLHLDEVKSILNSGEWQAVDPVQYKKMNALIDFLENSPIDSVVMELKTDLDNNNQFLKRDLRNVSEVDDIEGYIRAWEINNSLINIEKRTIAETPLKSIMVPEDQFIGMYSKLPLITYGNMSRLINDSIISMPDSLMFLIANSKLIHSAKAAKEADSIVNAYLDNARKEYNNKLIEAYRDSVSLQYRTEYLKKYIDSRKKQYTDSISKHNLQVLKDYNDSITSVVNQEFSSKLNSLITYIDRIPNDITIFNYFNEKSNLALQNDAVWYKWIWLKNSQNDSIGLRIENLDKHNVKVLIDEAVNLSRLSERGSLEVNKVQLAKEIDHKLLKVETRKPKLSPWKLDGKIYSGFTQTYINEYWSKGGNSSASTLSTFNYSANYLKPKLKFENSVDAKLGLIYYPKDDAASVERLIHKNTDNFEINSRLGFSAFKAWYYSAEANFKTQFFLGYKSNKDTIPNSSMFSPAYLTFSAGMDFKPNKDFSAFLSPVSVKTTYVTNPDVNETNFGLVEGETHRTRIGMAGKFELSKKVMDNISMKTRNSVFINYGTNKAGEWQLIKIPDFDSETTLDFKINQFISTQINFHFIYDKDVTSRWTDSNNIEQSGTKLQVKEFITFGISYKI